MYIAPEALMNMTPEQRIKIFIGRHKEPNQIPIAIHWYAQEHNVKVRKEVDLVPDSNPDGWGQQSYSCKSWYYGGSAWYEPDLKLVEIAWAQIRGTRLKPGEKRKWEYTDNSERYYIDSETHEAYNYLGKPMNKRDYIFKAYDSIHWYNTRFDLLASPMSHRMCGNDINNLIATLFPNETQYIYGIYSLIKKLARRPVKQTTVKTKRSEEKESLQELIFKLPQTLPPTSNKRGFVQYSKIDKYEVFSEYRSTGTLANVCFWDPKKKQPTNFAVYHWDGNTRPTNVSLTSSYCAPRLTNIEDFKKGGKYRDYIPDDITTYEAINIMRNPQIEQAYRMGCNNLGSFLLQNLSDRNTDYPRYFEMNYDPKSSIVENTGINVAKLKVLNNLLTMENYTYYDGSRSWSDQSLLAYRTLLVLLKTRYDKTSAEAKQYVNALDINQFIKYLKAITMLEIKPSDWNNEYIYSYGIGCVVIRSDDPLKELNKSMKVTSIIRTISDAYNMWNRLDAHNRPIIDWFSLSEREAGVLHNELISIYNQQELERDQRAKMALEEKDRKYKTRYNKLLPLEKDDGQYSIIVPKSGNDIRIEGMQLSHCVGGYMDRHLIGDTTILFLRKSDTPNISFYTIELDSYNTIRQIHGKHNCWLGNCPDAMRFVYHWIQEHHINCDKHILLCKSGGYGNTGEYLDSSELY